MFSRKKQSYALPIPPPPPSVASSSGKGKGRAKGSRFTHSATSSKFSDDEDDDLLSDSTFRSEGPAVGHHAANTKFGGSHERSSGVGPTHALERLAAYREKLDTANQNLTAAEWKEVEQLILELEALPVTTTHSILSSAQKQDSTLHVEDRRYVPSSTPSTRGGLTFAVASPPTSSHRNIGSDAGSDAAGGDNASELAPKAAYSFSRPARASPVPSSKAKRDLREDRGMSTELSAEQRQMLQSRVLEVKQQNARLHEAAHALLNVANSEDAQARAAAMGEMEELVAVIEQLSTLKDNLQSRVSALVATADTLQPVASTKSQYASERRVQRLTNEQRTGPTHEVPSTPSQDSVMDETTVSAAITQTSPRSHPGLIALLNRLADEGVAITDDICKEAERSFKQNRNHVGRTLNRMHIYLHRLGIPFNRETSFASCPVAEARAEDGA